MVLLADTEEIDDLAVKVVEDFHARRFLVKKHLCAARKSLDIGLVFGENLDDIFCYSILTTYVRQRTYHARLEFRIFFAKKMEGYRFNIDQIEAFNQLSSALNFEKVAKFAWQAIR